MEGISIDSGISDREEIEILCRLSKKVIDNIMDNVEKIYILAETLTRDLNVPRHPLYSAIAVAVDSFDTMRNAEWDKCPSERNDLAISFIKAISFLDLVLSVIDASRILKDSGLDKETMEKVLETLSTVIKARISATSMIMMEGGFKKDNEGSQYM